MPRPLVGALVCGSPHRNHDFDFARLRLAQALYDAHGIRTDCYNDYEDSAGILGADLLVSYTSQVPVSDEAGTAIRRFLDRRGPSGITSSPPSTRIGSVNGGWPHGTSPAINPFGTAAMAWLSASGAR